MILHVTLAGCTRAWRFTHSEPLDSWLSGRPWLNTGGVKVGRVATPECAAELAPALARAIRSHDDGASEVRVLHPGCATPGATFRDVVAEALGFSPQIARREYLRKASMVLRHRPVVLMFGPLPEGVGAAFHAAAGEFLDEVFKWGDEAVATVLFLDTPASPVAGEAFDLTTGGPSAPLGATSESETNLWRAYVHTRLAWETAGNLARAREWAGLGFAAIPTGQDPRLEALLNEVAQATTLALSADRTAQVNKYLLALGAGRALDRGVVRDLSGAGLLWKPSGDGPWRPVPWLARALLLGKAVTGGEDLLRGCLVCAPLAKEILNRCFDLEARARALLGPASAGRRAPEEIRDRLGRFEGGDESTEYPLYPRGCPAAPTDAWGFATFGELLFNLELPRRQYPHFYDLRDLRNSLSHGHYVSWHAVATLRRIERDLEA